MSDLIVAADTKVTWDGDPERTARDALSGPLAKVVLLNRSLALAVAGADPFGRIEGAFRYRNDRDQVLDYARSNEDASFILADADALALWQVRSGEIEVAGANEVAVIGDPTAEAVFRSNLNRWDAAGQDRLPSIRMSLDQPTVVGQIPAVGGYVLTAVSHEGKFALARWRAQVMTQGSPVRSVFVGRESTYRASGFLLQGADHGVLFTHDQPWKPVEVPAATPEEFVERAQTGFNQTVIE